MRVQETADIMTMPMPQENLQTYVRLFIPELALAFREPPKINSFQAPFVSAQLCDPAEEGVRGALPTMWGPMLPLWLRAGVYDFQEGFSLDAAARNGYACVSAF